jgi:signal transduction histidine kinase
VSARSAAAPAPGTFEAQERFAALAAHELRAPIALQRALVEVALADPDADTVALREMGERVLASCEQQQRLIEALLTLVRSRGGLSRDEPVDLAAITGEALQAHDLSALESVLVLEPAWTSGDPHLLVRLAANLVANAVRHNLPGGRIEVATRAGAGRAVLSVANTGPPIPSGELERLFQPFQRLAPEPPDTAAGVGLGLAVVQAIADAHDAAVSARAQPGGGLTIDVDFPAARRGSERVSAAPGCRACVSLRAVCETPGDVDLLPELALREVSPS